MKSKQLPTLPHRMSMDPKAINNETDLNFNAPRPSKLVHNGSTILKSNTTVYDAFQSRGKSGPVKDNTILKQIDSKLEMHKRDIEMRNDMIQLIERGVDAIRIELTKEKATNEELVKQNTNLQTQYQNLSGKFKNANYKMEEYHNRMVQAEKERDQLKQSNEIELGKYQEKEMKLKQMNHDLLQKLENKKEQPQDMGQINALRNQITSLEGKVEAQKTQVTELQSKLQQEQQDKNALREQQVRQKLDFEAKERDLTNQLEQSKNKMKLLQEQDRQKDVKELEKKQLELVNLNQAQKTEIEKLKQQMVEANKAKDLMQKELEVLKTNQEQLKQKELKANSRCDEMRNAILEKDQLLETLNGQMNQSTTIMETMKNELTKLQKEVEILNKQLQDQGKAQNNKIAALLGESIVTLEKSEKEMIKNLQCTFCKGFIKQPVTIIPCGHSYCFDCKKGYGKECSKCGPKLKVEAMYRNELLDDIIGMVKIIQGSITTMRSVTQ